MGVEVDGFTDSSRSRPFVNHGKLFRPCTLIDGSSPAPVDAQGWPLSDAQCLLFDVRPFPAWAPPIDDPEQFQPDWSGTWNLSVQGRADLTAFSDGNATVKNAHYDVSTDSTTAELVVAKQTGLLIINFANTSNGFRALRMIRPGYDASSSAIYTDEFLRSFTPFRFVRYMDFTDTNNDTPSSDPQQLIEWPDRRLVTDATQQTANGKFGTAWEYAILLANQTGTDMWINIPVAASDDYVRQLAHLINSRLNASLNVYIEHGNEVWNPGFANSYNFNRNSAQAEAAAGGSQLNNDGAASLDVLAVRLHLRRVVDAVNTFAQEMGSDQINHRIRGVFAWDTTAPGLYLNALTWYKSTYGNPSSMLYGVAQTHYYDVSNAAPNASPQDLVTAMLQSSDAGVSNSDQIRDLAAGFGLVQLAYEGGPNVGGGSTLNVGNRIEANRLPSMTDLVLHDLEDNFFDRGGSGYVYFTHCGSCSRYGCWGATEDIVNTNTPKFTALKQAAGVGAGPPNLAVNSFQNAASGASNIAPGSFVTLLGQNLTEGTWTLNDGMLDGSPALPQMLGGIQVRVGGSDAWVQYADPNQVNFVIPPGVVSGPNTIEVFTRFGVYTATVTVNAAAPGLFRYTIGGQSYASALFAGTATFVASEGALPGVASRPARGGDIVELYATGLGTTAQPYPANEVLAQVYPIADLSKVRVTIGGHDAAVLFAGLTYAGVFQVNVQIPDGLPLGDQPMVLSTNGVAASAVLLTVGQ